MKRTLGVLGSLGVHLLVVLLLVSHPQQVQKKTQPIAIEVGVSKDTKLKGEEQEGNGLACSGYHYTGVGILVGAGGRILDVGPNTPAAIAGLQEGDELVDFNQLAPDRFELGTVVNVLVRRAGIVISIPMKIGRICNE